MTSSTPVPSRTGTRPGRRAPAAAAVAALGLVASPGAASAHVRVLADSTTTGSLSALTIRVPNESDTASTVKVQVQLPRDSPFLSVSTKPIPGWTAATTEAKLPEPVEYGSTITEAVRTVTWSADRRAYAIEPGGYQEFSLSAGPLPATGDVLLPAAQTYSDGKVVNRDQPTPVSGEEPEYPAPALVVTAADDGTTPSPASDPAGASAEGPSGADWAARSLGIAGVVVCAAGIALAAAALRRRPKASV